MFATLHMVHPKAECQNMKTISKGEKQLYPTQRILCY